MKKLLILLIIMLVGCRPQEIVYETKEINIEKTLVDGTYEGVYDLCGELIPVERNNLYGFIDKNGNEIIKCVYSKLGYNDGFFNEFFQEDMLGVCKNGKYGFINNKGKEVISCIYDSIRPFNNSMAVVSKNGKYGVIDHNGKVLIDFIYDNIENFNEGIDKVMNANRYGYINEEGKEITACVYTMATDFNDGFATVYKDKKWIYINEQGKEIDTEYTRINSFNRGLAPVQKNGKWGIINTKFEEVMPCQLDYHTVEAFDNNGLAKVWKNNKYGYINEEGKEIIKCIYDNVMVIGVNSQMLVDKNKNGENVICINEVLIRVSKDNKNGLLSVVENTQCIERIPCTYYNVGTTIVNGNIYLMSSADDLGYMNLQGEEIILEDNYHNIGKFVDGIAAVRKNINGNIGLPGKSNFPVNSSTIPITNVAITYGLGGYINEEGKEIVKPVYDSVNDFSTDGLALVNKNGKYGYIDRKGKEIIPCEYEDATNFVNGMATVIEEGKCYILTIK